MPLQTNSLLGQKPILTAADKIEKALELKDEGNAFFKSGDYRKASRKYHYALMYAKAITLSVGDMQAIIPGLDSVARKYHSTEEEKSVATELTITLSNNLAGVSQMFLQSLVFCCTSFPQFYYNIIYYYLHVHMQHVSLKRTTGKRL